MIPTNPSLYSMFSGITTMGCCTIALFFLKFWTTTNDRLFAIFSSAFALMAVERFILGALQRATEAQPELYYLRLGAFVLIIVGILKKNRASR